MGMSASRRMWTGVSVVSVALLCSCATGENTEPDGVIKGRDARVDTADDDDTGSTDDDTGSADDDTGSPGDSATVNDSTADSGTTDTGTTDTGTTDTDPTSCSGEEAEPNNTEATARALGTIDDCDGSGKSTSGVISSSSDVDVYAFNGTDTFGCSVNPTVTATGSVTLCMKLACKSGTTELKSCTKGVKMGTECCGTSVEADVNCTGTTSDDTKVTITVRPNASASACAAYTLAYHY